MIMTDEIIVRAEEGDAIATKAREALRLIEERRGIIFFEAKGTKIRGRAADTVESLGRRWRMTYDFFGLTHEQRVALHQAYVVEQKSVQDTADALGMSALTAGDYIKAKGWMRDPSDYVKMGRNVFKQQSDATWAKDPWCSRRGDAHKGRYRRDRP